PSEFYCLSKTYISCSRLLNKSSQTNSTLSLPDALPIFLENGTVDIIFATYSITEERKGKVTFGGPYVISHQDIMVRKDDTSINTDRKSTRLNSSHVKISYAVFCLKKKMSRRLKACHRTS